MVAPKRTPQSSGGQARAARLTGAQRSAIAKQAALARWQKIPDPSELPVADSEGKLRIGNVEVDVYRLADRRRVISKGAMARVLGLKSEGGNAFMRTMTRPGVRSGLSEDLWHRIENPIHFKGLHDDLADGYLADDLIDVCDALISLHRSGKLHPSQHFLALQAEIIIRAAAKLGINKLVDEAVGYVSDRKDEYRKLFERFIAEECRQWEKEFPPKFFDALYRLYGLKKRDPDSNKHPQFFGKFIRRYIYHPLANSNGAILEYLDEKNPVIYENGGRRYKLHQWLDSVLGIFAFRQHLWQTIGIAEASSSKAQFDVGFYRAFPEATPLGYQWDFDLDD